MHNKDRDPGVTFSQSLVRGLFISICSRAVVFIVGALAVWLTVVVPPTGRSGDSDLRLLPGKWDAGWYMGIAGAGYRWRPDRPASRLAFFPAFPLALRGVGRAVRLPQEEMPWLWTGVVVSTTFFGVALALLYQLTRDLFSADAARRAGLVAAAYPFSLFHGQVYPESLFLLFAIGATLAARRGQLVLCALAGVGAGLSRPTGVLVAVLVAWGLSQSNNLRVRNPGVWAAVLGPAIGTAIYSAYVYWLTGSPLTWLTDQAGWGRAVQSPYGLLRDLAGAVHAAGLTGYIKTRPYEAINVAAFILALATVAPVWRRIGWGPALFVFASVVVPLVVGGLPSMGRYTAVLFPIFILFATNKVSSRLLIPVMALIQAALAT